MWPVFFLVLGAIGWSEYRRLREDFLRKKDIRDVTPKPSLPPHVVEDEVVGYAAPVTPPPAKTGEIARGDMPETPSKRALPSPIPGVSSEAWTKFCLTMRTQGTGDVSPSNAVGIFEMMPRRLVDLGILVNTKRVKSPKSGRMVLVGEFKPPMTEKIFTSNSLVQYNAFSESMRRYAEQLKNKGIESPKIDGMTLSGALAILHRSGPEGLKKWVDKKTRFPTTESMYNRTNGIF